MRPVQRGGRAADNRWIGVNSSDWGRRMHAVYELDDRALTLFVRMEAPRRETYR